MEQPATNRAASATIENVPEGAAFIVTAFLCVAMMSALGKTTAGISIGALTFSQNFVSLMLFLPWTLRAGVGSLKTEHLGLHLVRAITGLFSQGLMFLAVRRMPLMDAVLLSNSAPLFIPFVSRIWLKEKIGGTTLLSLIIGFVGVVFVLQPTAAMLRNPSALLAAGSAFCSALALVSVNRLSATESSRNVLFYYFLISSLASAPFILSQWQSPTPREWTSLVGIGLFMAISQLLIILAYKRARPERIGPFNYSVVVFSGLLGWIFWHQQPDFLSLIGVVLVCLGGAVSTIWGGPHSQGHFLWLGRWNHLLPWYTKSAT